MALSVLGPMRPSTAPALKPWSFSAACAWRTVSSLCEAELVPIVIPDLAVGVRALMAHHTARGRADDSADRTPDHCAGDRTRAGADRCRLLLTAHADD